MPDGPAYDCLPPWSGKKQPAVQMAASSPGATTGTRQNVITANWAAMRQFVEFGAIPKAVGHTGITRWREMSGSGVRTSATWTSLRKTFLKAVLKLPNLGLWLFSCKVRGGSFANDRPFSFRCAHDHTHVSSRTCHGGFRVALSPVEPNRTTEKGAVVSWQGRFD